MIKRSSAVQTGLLVVLAAGLCACGAPEPQPGVSPATTVATPAILIAGVPLKNLPAAACKVEWGEIKAPAALTPGEAAVVSVSLKNVGNATWPAGGTKSMLHVVRLSHRWLRPDGKALASYVGRADLAQPLKPGEGATLSVSVQAPAAPGSYGLQFDLVHEGVAWFEGYGNGKKVVPVRVK